MKCEGRPTEDAGGVKHLRVSLTWLVFSFVPVTLFIVKKRGYGTEKEYELEACEGKKQL